MTIKKKLIEVALPLDAINKAAAREKSSRHGHPSTLHLWWARRPLAAARAVIFAQMVDDPSAHPDLFPTEKKQEKERRRLLKIIEDLVLWENTTNETVLQRARDEIWQSWRYACAENADHPRAKELFNRYKLPAFHDPFAGGGALPLEAQRLGLEAYASDLNPVAVLINKAMVREALALINQTLDEVLAEQEGDFDADSRFALAWFEQHSFGEGPYGVAEVLSKAKNTSITGMETAGILSSQGGRVCLLRPDELPAQWDLATDSRLTIWEIVHHLTHALETGEEKAAQLLARIRAVSPDKADAARELAYRLYTLCERKKRAQEALAYNGLLVSWPELMQRAQTHATAANQQEMF